MARTRSTQSNGITLAPNMRMEQDGDEIVLRINTATEEGLSKSGKNVLVSSTHGFARLPNGLGLSLNLTRPATDEDR